MENSKMTIKEIADLAGVSKSTVSRYLNRGYVSEEKAERVRKVIEETGYQTNFFAKRLKMKHSKLVGIVLPRMDSVTVGKLLTGIHRVFLPAGYQGILLVSNLDADQEIENILSLQQQGVDGIIVDSIGITERHLEVQRAMELPLIFTGQMHEDVHYIKFDDRAAGRMMGAYLRSMGHKRAVFAGVTETDLAVGVDRKQGFIDAFTEGAPGASVDFVETGFDFLSAYHQAEYICSLEPSVVVGATDNICLGLLRYFHERHVRVPAEISVAGFGGYDVGAVVYPALTTIAFDYELVGMKTAKGMLDLIAGKKLGSEASLPLFFVERESVRRMDQPYVEKPPEQLSAME